MALRDIFDSDPRSKDQLREELRLHGVKISDLSRHLDELRAKEKATLLGKEDLGHRLQAEKLQVSSLQAQISEAQANIDHHIARERRLAERESAVNKNFAELARRGLTSAEPVHNAKLTDTPAGKSEEPLAIEKQTPQDATVASLRAELAEMSDRLTSSIRQQQAEQIQPGVIAQSAAREGALRAQYSELLSRFHQSEFDNAQLRKESASLRASQTADANLATENSELRQRVANWTSFHAEREAQLSKREGIALTQPVDKKRLSRPDFHIPTFMQESVLAWMFSETRPDALQVKHGYLHLMGDGPWDNDAFGRLMEGQDFSLWKLPDADIAHLVVGRNHWSEADLVAQIAARQGQALRIYSQEMWVAAMATGRDPFDADDPDLLHAFAMGHEALDFLIHQNIPWPTVSSHPRGDVTPVDSTELGVVASPMHLMDYRVGKTSPHSEEQRRVILNEIFCSRALPFGDDCSAVYRSNWGTPKSAQRLYRMASHIKFIVEGPNGSDYRKPVAREDWINDLAWLKKTYFRKTVHAFKWPNTHVS